MNSNMDFDKKVNTPFLLEQESDKNPGVRHVLDYRRKLMPNYYIIKTGTGEKPSYSERNIKITNGIDFSENKPLTPTSLTLAVNSSDTCFYSARKFYNHNQYRKSYSRDRILSQEFCISSQSNREPEV